MLKHLRATSLLLPCICLILLLTGCGGSSTTTSSNNPAAPGNPPTGNGNNPGGSTPSNAAETLYESFGTIGGSPDAIRAFRVDSTNGTLSQLAGFPVNGPFQGLAASPAGNLLFNLHGDTAALDTTAYQINATTAALTQSADNPGVGGGMAFHPNNKFVYILDSFKNTLSGFAFDASGHFSPLPGSPYPVAGATLNSFDISPNGRFLYVASSNQNSVIGYSVDPSSGALTMLPGMPMQVRTFTPCDCPRKDPSGIVLTFSGDNQNLFIEDAGDGFLSSYSVNQSSGAITKVATVTDRPGTTNLVVTPSSRFLYDIGSGSACCTIRGYVIGPGGTLAPMGSTFNVPTGPETFINTEIFLDPSGRFLYQENNSGTFSGYVIDQNTGNLSPNGQVITDSIPISVAIAK